MKKNSSKKAYILMTTLFTIFFVIMAMGTFVKYTTTITLQEFHKDLAKIRGYWAAYGFKEYYDSSWTGSIPRKYKYYRMTSDDVLYDIKADEQSGKYTWEIINSSSSGIKDADIFKRTITIDGSDSSKMLSYEK